MTCLKRSCAVARILIRRMKRHAQTTPRKCFPARHSFVCLSSLQGRHVSQCDSSVKHSTMRSFEPQRKVSCQEHLRTWQKRFAQSRVGILYSNQVGWKVYRKTLDHWMSKSTRKHIFCKRSEELDPAAHISEGQMEAYFRPSPVGGAACQGTLFQLETAWSTGWAQFIVSLLTTTGCQGPHHQL